MSEQEQDTIDAMKRYGGSFVKQLAELYMLGDPINQRRLAREFSDYFERYARIASDDRARASS